MRIRVDTSEIDEATEKAEHLRDVLLEAAGAIERLRAAIVDVDAPSFSDAIEGTVDFTEGGLIDAGTLGTANEHDE